MYKLNVNLLLLSFLYTDCLFIAELNFLHFLELIVYNVEHTEAGSSVLH